jgi:hypothetical protein
MVLLVDLVVLDFLALDLLLTLCSAFSVSGKQDWPHRRATPLSLPCPGRA